MKTFIAPLAFIVAVVIVTRATAMLAVDDPNTKEGTFVSLKMGKLTLTETGGKQTSLHVADAVQVIVNGKPAKLMDLKKGMQIRAKLSVDGDVILIMTIDENIKR
jgi:hypothetical protein